MTSTSEMRRRSSPSSKVEKGGAEDESARRDDLDYVGPQLSRGAVFAQISKGAVGAEDKGAKPPRCSPNVQALAVSAFLFSCTSYKPCVMSKKSQMRVWKQMLSRNLDSRLKRSLSSEESSCFGRVVMT